MTRWKVSIAKIFRHERSRRVVDIADAEIGKSIADLVRHHTVQPLAQVKFDAGKSSAVVRDQAGQHGACQRNHARDHDLPAWMSGHLPHIFGADPQIVEQALRKCREFLSGVRDGDLPGAAGKQRYTQFGLDQLDRARQGRLRYFQRTGRSDETSILGDRENGLELSRTQVGEDMTGHVGLAINANNRNNLSYRKQIAIDGSPRQALARGDHP